MQGPLGGIKVIVLAGLGHGPPTHCGMMLADLGADVVRVDRKSDTPRDPDHHADILGRGQRSIQLDLKDPADVEAALGLIGKAEILIEGFRPGVTERLGLGPEDCFRHNKALVYGRMTGWGQTGPMAHRVGHDINYVGLSGALYTIGRGGETPVPPVNYVADMGGGAVLMAFGLAAALLHARATGEGQVVDAAMVDGCILQMGAVFLMKARGLWVEARGANMLDTGAHFYEVYETADGGYMAVGAIEPQFYAALCRHAELDPDEFAGQMDRARWPALKERLAAVFRTKTRAEWTSIFDGVDACVTPVLSPWEAASHPHNRARENLLDLDGVLQPAPAPRFSRTPGAVNGPPPRAGEHTEAVFRDWGVARP